MSSLPGHLIVIQTLISREDGNAELLGILYQYYESRQRVLFIIKFIIAFIPPAHKIDITGERNNGAEAGLASLNYSSRYYGFPNRACLGPTGRLSADYSLVIVSIFEFQER